QGPDLHLTEALTAELGLTAQRLLGDHRVRTGGAGVELVVHQVVQLQDVQVAHDNRLAERLTGAAVEEPRLRVQGHQTLAVPRGAPAQVGLEHLADVHPARYAQRVEDDVHGGAVLEERHVLHGQDLGDDALIAVPAGELVTHGDLAPLGDVDTHQLVHARG